MPVVASVEPEKETEPAGELSEEEAMALAMELESLEAKEESLPEAESRGEYPRDEYPYSIEEDRKSFDGSSLDIIVGDRHYAMQINDWYMNFSEYAGKTVELEGYYMNFKGYTLIGRRGPSCPYCTGG